MKFNTNYSGSLKKGFTLIELLVVIAIIGILSSVVLASLNTARGKGNDAKVKAQLASLRARAEIAYDNLTQKYSATGVAYDSIPAANATCTATANTIFADSTVVPYVTGTNYPTGVVLSCHINAAGSAYAVSGLLPGAGGTNAWCVDSAGNSRSELTNLANGVTVCP